MVHGRGVYNTNLRISFLIMFPNNVREEGVLIYLFLLSCPDLVTMADVIMRLYNITQFNSKTVCS